MSHLSIERLAALADEQPTSDENMHLMQCAECAREREAHRSLLTMAGSERDAAHRILGDDDGKAGLVGDDPAEVAQ